MIIDVACCTYGAFLDTNIIVVARWTRKAFLGIVAPEVG
jgi:hypothetical protein